MKIFKLVKHVLINNYKMNMSACVDTTYSYLYLHICFEVQFFPNFKFRILILLFLIEPQKPKTTF